MFNKRFVKFILLVLLLATLAGVMTVEAAPPPQYKEIWYRYDINKPGFCQVNLRVCSAGAWDVAVKVYSNTDGTWYDLRETTSGQQWHCISGNWTNGCPSILSFENDNADGDYIRYTLIRWRVPVDDPFEPSHWGAVTVYGYSWAPCHYSVKHNDTDCLP